MATRIGPYNVRRSTWIDASPDRVWQEFTTFERMRAWFGTGHTLVRYEPVVGAIVETDAGTGGDEHDGERLVFVGKVLVVDPPHELTFEQDWIDHGWPVPAKITFRLTPLDDGTLVELFHHGFEAFGKEAGENLRGFEGGWTTRHLEALREIVAP